MKTGHIQGTNENGFPNIGDIFKARDLLNEAVRKTPLQRSETFSKLTGTNIFLKLESLQRTGSFKVRGAFVKLDMLSNEERKYGVIAASAGNHAQGVAYAALKKKYFLYYCHAQECISGEGSCHKIIWSEGNSSWFRL